MHSTIPDLCLSQIHWKRLRKSTNATTIHKIKRTSSFINGSNWSIGSLISVQFQVFHCSISIALLNGYSNLLADLCANRCETANLFGRIIQLITENGTIWFVCFRLPEQWSFNVPPKPQPFRTFLGTCISQHKRNRKPIFILIGFHFLMIKNFHANMRSNLWVFFKPKKAQKCSTFFGENVPKTNCFLSLDACQQRFYCFPNLHGINNKGKSRKIQLSKFC